MTCSSASLQHFLSVLSECFITNCTLNSKQFFILYKMEIRIQHLFWIQMMKLHYQNCSGVVLLLPFQLFSACIPQSYPTSLTCVMEYLKGPVLDFFYFLCTCTSKLFKVLKDDLPEVHCYGDDTQLLYLSFFAQMRSLAQRRYCLL